MRTMNRMAVLALPFLSVALPASPALAGAWTQPEGKGLIILTADYTIADSGFDADGQTVKIQPFRKMELRGYVEYGLTDWATLVAQPEWRDKRTGTGEGEAVSGLGRVDAGLRVRVWQGEGSVASVQGSIRAPGASDRLAPANGGDTDWELDARLLYGRGFTIRNRSAFSDVQIGYRIRQGDPADELRLDMTAGLNLTPDVLALLQSFNSLSVGETHAPFVPTREHKVAASAVYSPDDVWSIQVGGTMALTGSNTLQEYGAFFGLWRKF